MNKNQKDPTMNIPWMASGSRHTGLLPRGDGSIGLSWTFKIGNVNSSWCGFRCIGGGGGRDGDEGGDTVLVGTVCIPLHWVIACGRGRIAGEEIIDCCTNKPIIKIQCLTPHGNSRQVVKRKRVGTLCRGM